MTNHIRETLRAFPVADLAKALLRGRDRYEVIFEVSPDAKPLYQCPSDSSLWMTRDEAVSHLLRGDNLKAFYEVEEVETGAPAGNFSVVAVCGMSGELLGPPNHHEYQRNVARLHAERFSNMPIDRFKSRIVMESGEEAIERWKEKVSKTLHYRVKQDEEDGSTESPEEVQTPESESEEVELTLGPAGP